MPLHLASFTWPAEVLPPDHPLAGATGVVMSFAVRHAQGLVLFETGIGEGNAHIDRLYKPTRYPLSDALAAHGFELGDVSAIVNSHLHFDHCGNNSLFAGVPIYAQASEVAAALEPWYTVKDWVQFPGADIREVDGDVDLGHGIRVVATPGHTVGHQSVVVDTVDGTVVLAGQAIFDAAECRELSNTTGDVSTEPGVVTARDLLGRRPRRVHFSHDTAVWEPSD
jgi:glyoxylase-like metal-dependent hydrolase (beta-lactamase superfamily II)